MTYFGEPEPGFVVCGVQPDRSTTVLGAQVQKHSPGINRVGHFRHQQQAHGCVGEEEH